MKTVSLLVSISSIIANDVSAPGYSVVTINQHDIDELRTVRELLKPHASITEIRTQAALEFPGYDQPTGIFEMVRCHTQVWFTATLDAYEPAIPVESPGVDVESFLSCFDSANSGDLLVFTGGDTSIMNSVIDDMEENEELKTELSEAPIGYQVVHEDGEHWDEKPSFFILSYATACKDWAAAKASKDGWQLSPICLDTIEEPTFEYEC